MFENISFPGISDPIRLCATRTVGMSPPGVALLWAPPQAVSSSIGNLTFGINETDITWTDALIDSSNTQATMQGQFQLFVIHDRRWRHQKHHVTGAFNIREDDSSIDPSTEKTLPELVQWLFLQINESVDVSAIDSTEKPHVSWDRESFPHAVDDLLESRGYVATLTTSNVYKIYKVGVGASFYDDGDLVYLSNSVDPPELPYKLTGVCARTRIQSKLKCRPVGLDNDRSVKPVDDLSYKPAGGWDNVDMETFASITDPIDRELALQSVGRWYMIESQADGTHTGGEYSMDSIRREIPVREDLVESNINPFVHEFSNKAFVEANYFDDFTNPPTGENNPDFTLVQDVNWQILTDVGMVVFDSPIRYAEGSIDSRVMKFAEVYLTTSYSPTDSTLNLKDRYEVDRFLGGTGKDILQMTSLRRTLICNYGEDHITISSITDNYATIDSQANILLSHAVNRYATLNGQTLKYRGIKNYNVDGIVRQVIWECAVNTETPFATTVSINMEGDPRLISTGRRARIRINHITNNRRTRRSTTP